MKVKTAEALMFGKPIIGTDEALEGYDVERQRSVFRCNSSQDFINAINNYAKSIPLVSFDDDLHRLFLEKYHTPNYVPVLRELLFE